MDAGSSHTGIFVYSWQPKELVTDKNELNSVNNSEVITSMPEKIEQIDKCEVHNGGIAELNVNSVKDYFKHCMSKLSLKLKKHFKDETLELTEKNVTETNEDKSSAKAIVNEEEKKTIPVYLEATAGMRLLNLRNSSAVENLFSHVKSYLNSIRHLNSKDIRIIPGTLEGFYSWLTVNYLTDTLANNEKTYAIIECGGASTQIAHEVIDSSKVETAITDGKLNKSDLHQVTLWGNKRYIRSTSFLCYGKDQFNLRVISLLILNKFKEDNSIYQYNRVKIDNPCMNSGLEVVYFKKSFVNQPCLEFSPRESSFQMNNFKDDVQFLFKGSSKPELCTQLIESIINESTCSETFDHCVTNYNLFNPDEKIYAISAFYHAAVALSDIKNFKGKISREQFNEKSIDLCHKNWKEIDDKKNRFMKSQCFSCLLVKAMIEQMYHINDWNKIQFVKKVKGDSIGWTLGSILMKTRNIKIKYTQVNRIGDNVFYSIATLCVIVLIGACFTIIWSLYKKQQNVVKDENEENKK